MTVKDFFRDKKGELVIWQTPNTPLWIALGFWVLGFVPISQVESISKWGTSLALLYWSHLEIVSGDSPFRRVLGLIVFTSVVLQFFG